MGGIPHRGSHRRWPRHRCDEREGGREGEREGCKGEGREGTCALPESKRWRTLSGGRQNERRKQASARHTTDVEFAGVVGASAEQLKMSCSREICTCSLPRKSHVRPGDEAEGDDASYATLEDHASAPVLSLTPPPSATSTLSPIPVARLGNTDVQTAGALAWRGEEVSLALPLLSAAVSFACLVVLGYGLSLAPQPETSKNK